jgi:hypothetical protein
MRVALLFLIALAALAAGFGYYDGMTRGTLTHGYTPIAAATGGVFSLGYEPAMGAVTNPAALTMAGGARMEAGLLPGSWECWHIYPNPMRDRRTTGLYLGGLSAGFVGPLSAGWSLGAAVAKVSDYRMTANIVEYEDEQYETTAVRMVESHGGLYELSAAAGYRATDWLSVGLSGGARLGSGSWDETIEDYVNATTVVNKVSWTASEPCMRAGLLARRGRLTGAAVFSSGSERMPSGLTVGTRVSFHVLADGELGVEYQVQPALSDSLVNLRAFMAVKGVYPGVTSFYSITCRQEHQQHSSAMGGSFGLEIPIGRVGLIASLGWNGSDRRNSLFDDYYMSRIETTYTTVSLGMRTDL